MTAAKIKNVSSEVRIMSSRENWRETQPYDTDFLCHVGIGNQQQTQVSDKVGETDTVSHQSELLGGRPAR